MLWRLIKLTLLLALIFGGLQLCKPKRYPPGILIHSEPEQVILTGSSGRRQFKQGEFTLQPQASFLLEARVLGLKRYYSDLGAKISPCDLAAGWGPMSDQSVLDQLEISQGNRFFFYEWKGTPPLPVDQIASHATNIHLVPAASAIERDLLRMRRGDLVRLQGLLVDISGPEMKLWRSSLSRTDTGKGACEILWVSSVENISQ